MQKRTANNAKRPHIMCYNAIYRGSIRQKSDSLMGISLTGTISHPTKKKKLRNKLYWKQISYLRFTDINFVMINGYETCNKNTYLYSKFATEITNWLEKEYASTYLSLGLAMRVSRSKFVKLLYLVTSPFLYAVCAIQGNLHRNAIRKP